MDRTDGRTDGRMPVGSLGVGCFFSFLASALLFPSDQGRGENKLILPPPPPTQQHSAIGSGVFLVAAGFCFQLHWPPAMLIASLCLFMGFFSVGMGAITFVVASELFPLPVRGKAMALTVFVNRLLRYVCGGVGFD